MSEHDETLRKALEENVRLRSERAANLREGSSAEFRGRLRLAERVYWLYALVCVAIGVAAINGFIGSLDTKTLIGCAVIMLVVYETTVLMKLWFATAAMKLSVLKDVKLLRLEVARLATSVGAEGLAEPTVKYEPMRGTSRWERRLWVIACVVAAAAVSSWTRDRSDLGGGSLTDRTLVTIAPDGSATSVADIEQSHSSYHLPKEFPYFAPKEQRVRFLDPEGGEMPAKMTPADTHIRYDVTLSKAAFSSGKIRHTRISEIPKAAMLEDGVWSCEYDVMYSLRESRFTVTVSLPPGARLVSASPAPALEFDLGGRAALRFHATRGRNESFNCKMRYELLPPPTEGE